MTPTVLLAYCFSKETKLQGVRAVLTAYVLRVLGSINSIDGSNATSPWSMCSTDGADTVGTWGGMSSNECLNTRSTWSMSSIEGLNYASTRTMGRTHRRVQVVPAVQTSKILGVPRVSRALNPEILQHSSKILRTGSTSQFKTLKYCEYYCTS